MSAAAAEPCADLVRFFAAIHPPGSLGYLELRVIDPLAERLVAHEYGKTPEALARLVRQLSAKRPGCNVYVGCAARKTHLPGSKANLQATRVLWADMDGCAVEDALAAVALSDLPPPSIVVASGGGVHLYWCLTEPLPLRDPANVAKLEAILRGIARELRADPAATDAPRILRPPETVNHPNAKKRAAGRMEQPVRLVELDADRRYALAVFEPLAVERAAKAADIAGATWPAWDGAEEGDLPDHLQALLAEHAILRRYFDRTGKLDGEDHSESARDWALARCAACYVGSAEDVYTLTKASRLLGVGDGKAEDRDAYFRRTALKAWVDEACAREREVAAAQAQPEADFDAISPDPNEPAPARRIIVSGRHRDELADEVAAAVVAMNDPPSLFRRGGDVVLVYRGEHGEACIRKQNVSRFQEVAARAARYFKVQPTREGGVRRVPTGLPETETGVALERLVVKDLLPPLRGLVHNPLLRADGSIVSSEGYHAASGLYLDPIGPPLQLTVPERPTVDDARAAAAALLEVLDGFPFADATHRANALALLLTLPLRELVEGPVPLFAVDAPTAGSGKSLLVRVACTLATGRPAPAMPEPGSDDEWRKRILALLLGGSDIAFLDNLEKPLRNGHLAGVLTAWPDWSDRVLGKSETPPLPHRAVWFATGNNLDVRGDLTRRAVWVRIDPRVARPDERADFNHPDLLGWVRAERPRLLGAAFTIGRAWLAAGRPDADAPELGSFEAWRRVVGGALRLCGVEGFLANRGAMFEALSDGHRSWGPFLAAWLEELGAAPVSARELAAKMVAASAALLETVPDEFPDVLDAKAPSLLGYTLRAQRDRRHPAPDGSTVWLEHAGADRNGVARWRVRRG